VKLVKEGKRPFLLSPMKRDVEGRLKVFPFVAAFHDYYHLATFSQLPDEIRSVALSLIEIMEEVGMIQEEDTTLGALLDGLLSESDPGFEMVFEEMSRGPLKDPILVEIFYEKIKEKVKDHPNRKIILAKFEKIFGAKLGMGDWDTLPPSEG
jgi:hypothetical protein